MVAWRTLASLIVGLIVTGSVRAQTYALKEAPLEGSYFEVQLTMDLGGEIRVQKAGKQVALKQTARATHAYYERVLEAPEGKQAIKTARFYTDARATFAVGEDRSERAIRPERRLLVAQRSGDQLVTFCTAGPLTAEELELTQHFDTLALAGLLPDKEVRPAETWKVGNAVAQALCHFDGLTGQDLECRLELVAGDVARFSVKGTATGIDSGASVKSTVRADCAFDCQARRLTSIKWQQTDEREQGPTSPAMTLSLTLTVARAPCAAVSQLHDFALTAIPDGPLPPEAMTALLYRDSKKRFEMVYARAWQLVARTEDFVVLRLLDRGDFVAQATITPLRRAAGKVLADDEFKELVNATPGWQPDAEAKVEEITPSGGKASSSDYTIKRLAAQGKLDDLKTTQYCYLLANPQGDQLIVSFTMTPAQVATLDTRDLALVRGITFCKKGTGTFIP